MLPSTERGGWPVAWNYLLGKLNIMSKKQWGHGFFTGKEKGEIDGANSMYESISPSLDRHMVFTEQLFHQLSALQDAIHNGDRTAAIFLLDIAIEKVNLERGIEP